ncbi:MAG: hypothetical protein LBC80_07800 [Treponema sp.]|nr:hypothetical protein [Treponema sp.]
MYTKHKVLTAVLVLFTVLCIPSLAAQIMSNTNIATNGLFNTDADNFLNVHNWQDVEFDQFFTTMQVDGEGGIGMGLALNAGSAFLGFGYTGTFWEGTVNSLTTEYGNNYSVANWRGKESVSRSGNGLKWNSQLFFLLGTDSVGGLLFDLNFANVGNHNRDSESLNAGGVKETTKNSVGFGAIEAGLTWGKSFDIGDGLSFSPRFGFSYNIDLQKTVADIGPGSALLTTLTGRSGFFVRPGAGYSNINGGVVGLTGYITSSVGLQLDLSKNARDGSLWLDYGLEYHMFDKQTSGFSYWEDFNPAFMRNSVDIGFGVWHAVDRRLSFGWFTEFGFDLINASVTSITRNDGVKPMHEFNETILEINPMIAAGVVYKAVPDKLNFNGSLTLHPFNYTRIKFEHTNNTSTETATTITNTIGKTITETSMGLTWFIMESLSLDFAIAASRNARIDVTQFSTLLSYKR